MLSHGPRPVAIDQSAGNSKNVSATVIEAPSKILPSTSTPASFMEGPLSKWTNVMKGWQFRWFVLDETMGLLSYYTSKEKMRRGVRRGCIRLQGAVLGIDDEEDSNFTITVDSKVFHLQAKDAEEREIWVKALEESILRHARLRPGGYLPHHLTSDLSDSMEEPLHKFEQRVAQADAYLEQLIDQVVNLEKNPALHEVAEKGNEFLDAVKHSIVLLQIAKNTAFPVTGIAPPVILHYSDQDVQTGIEYGSECREAGISKSVNQSVSIPEPAQVVNALKTQQMEVIVAQSPISPTEKNPVFLSYSSSDDDQDFFDASEDIYDEDATNSATIVDDGKMKSHEEISKNTDEVQDAASRRSTLTPDTTAVKSEKILVRMVSAESCSVNDHSPLKSAGTLSQPPKLDDLFDWDSLYDEEDPEEDLGSVESQGSVLSHLLSQVKIGMDLTKVVLPTFILERRSLLEMYADFFAHPDMFVAIADAPTPKERIVSVLRWYLGAFHAGRRSDIAKKPYNPILGETFQCYWKLAGNSASKDSYHKKSSQGATSVTGHELLQWVEDPDALIFFGEQVSHHPPISAFYAEHIRQQISLNAHIWTKSKFLGLSVGVHNIGHATITVHRPAREEYVFGFPNGYARSIFSVPWVELGGSVTISCVQTGYNARVEFLTKPFFGGDKNKITAQVFSPEDKKKSFLSVEGEWNGLMSGKWSDGRTEKFVDVRRLNIVKKETRSIAKQDPYESRKLWKDVTRGLKFKNIENATDAKFFLEDRQRKEARERSAKNETWKPKMFIPAGDTWIFSQPLEQRLKMGQKFSYKSVK